MATFYDNGETYELPAMDMRLWEKVEAVDNADPGRATFKAMHEFVKECLPEDYLEAKLGGKSLDKIDLNKLNICAFAVRAAYNREVSEAKSEVTSGMLEQLKDVADDVSRIATATNAVNSVTGRKAFRAAR